MTTFSSNLLQINNNFLSKDLCARYYQKNIEKIQRKSCERYKQEYGCKKYKNLSETEKERVVEYRKIYHELQKNIKIC